MEGDFKRLTDGLKTDTELQQEDGQGQDPDQKDQDQVIIGDWDQESRITTNEVSRTYQRQRHA